MGEVNEEFIARWVEALRSGKYEQGRGWLKDSEGRYCCLGVGCEVAGDDVAGHLPSPSSAFSSFMGGVVSVPVTIDGHRERLEVHNDNYGRTFDEIADALEQEFYGE